MCFLTAVVGLSSREMGHQGFSGSNSYYHATGSGSADSHPKAEPENKGALPYIPLKAGYRSEKQSLIHIWLHASLLATSPSVLCDLPYYVVPSSLLHCSPL
jgi:hypothetical protein